MGTSQSRISRRRAFVVQYGDDARLERGEVFGRVEHVDSGRSARFSSQRELDAFVLQILNESARGFDEDAE